MLFGVYKLVILFLLSFSIFLLTHQSSFQLLLGGELIMLIFLLLIFLVILIFQDLIGFGLVFTLLVLAACEMVIAGLLLYQLTTIS